MAQTFRSLSSLLIVVACCFLNGATAEEREGKQILLPAAANFPVYYYASGRPAFVNAGETPTGTEARVSSKLLSSPDDYGTDAVGRTFFRIFGCPSCPTCPGPCPTCAVCPATPSNTCPVCPPIPAACPGTTNAADPILITINGALTCTDAATGVNNFGTGGCTRVTAAPTGVFTVSFTGGANANGPYPTAFIGIVATCPNTRITVKCGTFTTAVVTTQTAGIAPGGFAILTGSALITVGRGTQAIDSVSCTWTASV